MFQVFEDSLSITSLVPGSGTVSLSSSWHSTGYEQDWNGARVGFGTPPGSISTRSLSKPLISVPLAWLWG